jgi:dihydrofolate reductase
MTMGHIVVMGRKTFESLPNGPLRGRINVVLTREIMDDSEKDREENVYFANMRTLFQLLASLVEMGQKTFVIGGAEIYDLLFDECHAIHATVVDGDFLGNPEAKKTYFPRLAEITSVFEKTRESEIMFSDNAEYQYITYDRHDDVC